MGWFYGFKFHLDRALIPASCWPFVLTPGHVDDRQPVPPSPRPSSGSSLGIEDISPKRCMISLLAPGLALLTKVRKNMKNRLMRLWDKLLLRKRMLIEPINDQLKNISQIEHTQASQCDRVYGQSARRAWSPIALNPKNPRWVSSVILCYQCDRCIVNPNSR